MEELPDRIMSAAGLEVFSAGSVPRAGAAMAGPDTLAAVINSIDHGIAAFDARDRLIAFNRRFHEIFADGAGGPEPGMSYAAIVGLRATDGAAPATETRAAQRRDVLRR